ncbi:MAG TPA: DUF6543 domain-containing protein [Pseudomonas sp.]
MTTIEQHPHHDFIKQSMPAWYVNASAELRQRLNDDIAHSHELREQLGHVLAPLKGLVEFAKPLLEKALLEKFGPGLDVEHDRFEMGPFYKGLIPKDKVSEFDSSSVSLLQAALHNFHQEDVDSVKATSLYDGTQLNQRAIELYQYPEPLKVPAVEFIALCRELDLGGKYQAHLNTVVGPWEAGEGRAASAMPLKNLIGSKEYKALRVQAHIALMKKDISAARYDNILGLSPDPQPSDPRATLERVVDFLDQPLVPERPTAPMNYYALGMLGIAVRDVLVFQAPGESACVVYMPNEPATPLKEYESLGQFMAALRGKLRQPAYQAYLTNFIAQRSKAVFAVHLENCLNPFTSKYMPGEEGKLIPRVYKQREWDDNADLRLELDQIPYSLYNHFHFQKMLRIKDDARCLAVPTGDEDAESRRARLAAWIERGMNIANFMAFFVPGLGEVMMVVAGAQLLNETFQGVEAWRHGDMQEALGHLASVAENIAVITAFGALGKIASPGEIPPVTGSSFVGKMVPVKLPGGATRLWSPDLTPFAHDIVLPKGTELSGEGTFTHLGKRYLPLEGKFYPVKHDPVLNKWRIEAPRGQRFSPVLEHNGAGGWRHEGENPLSWEVNTSFKRLSPMAAQVPDSAIAGAMKVAAIDEAQLLELHLTNQAPGPALADTIERFSVEEQVQVFQRKIGDAASYETADPYLQLELLTGIHRWSPSRRIQVVDAQGAVLAEYGASAAPDAQVIPVTERQLAEGKLLETVIEGMGEAAKNRMFGRNLDPTPANLAARLASESQGLAPQLFDWLYARRQSLNDPLVQLIKRDFPGLPTVAARHMLAEATPAQISGMNAAQKIPLELAGQARGYLRQARINRALEGFCLPSQGANPDTFKVAFQMMGDLPGWPGDLCIQIRQGTIDGPLLDSLGEISAPQRRTLIQQGTDYRVFDANGNELDIGQNLHNNFFSAVLHGLPAEARQAIGFADPVRDVEGLRLRIIERAMSDRRRVAKILGQQELGPGFHAPERLPDGRIGYRLSGRPGTSVTRYTEDLIDLLQEIYPDAPNVRSHVYYMLTHDIGYDVEGLVNQTLTRQQRLETLRLSLEGWVDPPRGSTSQVALARRSVAEAISRAVRNRQPMSPLSPTPLLLEGVDLSLIGDLPVLPGYYRDIESITLRNVAATPQQIDALLEHFPNLTRVELIGGGVTRLPRGLARLRQLNELSLEGMGMTIDQSFIDSLSELRSLLILDISGNRMGEVTDISGLVLSRLYMTDMSLSEWPTWTDNLSLHILDVSRNRIEHLPRYLLENEQGNLFELTVYGHGNPFNHDELLQCWLNQRGHNIYELEYDYPEDIRRLAPTPEVFEGDSSGTSDSDYDSSDDDTDWHSHNGDHVPPPAPVPSVDNWIIEGRTELNSRIRIAWDRVEQAGDAPNLLILLERLRGTPDFLRVHEELTNDVMGVLEAATDNPQLRGQLEIMANDRLHGADQTCQDGARLIFSDIQVSVYAETALAGVPEDRQTETLFGVIRRLFRLNEVQTIADLEIANREQRGLHVDHAEVRMAYRIQLANELSLPGQPVRMVWERLAAVDRQAILGARRLVLERELGPDFLEYAIEDQRWAQHLRTVHQADFERITAPIKARMDALEEHPPLDMAQNLRRRSAIYERLNAAHAANDPVALAAATSESLELDANPVVDHNEYDRQGRALIAELAAAEKALLRQLTHLMRQAW